MPLAGDTAPRHTPARAQPTRLAHGPACSCHLRSCVSQAIELVHHAPRQSHVTAMAVASCLAELAPNGQGSRADPTMSAVAVAVVVMTNMSGRKKSVGLRQMRQTH